jgi:hypothetical protein
MKNFKIKGFLVALLVLVAVAFGVGELFAKEAADVVLAGAPLTIIFAKDIEANIFPNNEFYMNAKDDSAFVEGKTVKHPVAGLVPNVEINRTQLPATITKREDDENSYDLNEFTTDPTLIQDIEEIETNYSKRQNVLADHIDTLNTKIATFFANLWLPNGSDNIVRSSGTTARVASAPGASGNRKRITKEDFIEVSTKFNRMDVPTNGRLCVMPAEFLEDLLLIDGFVEADKIGKANLIEGQIGRLLGFDIFIRSTVGVYTNDGTPVKKALGAATATSDNLAALFWYKGWVNRAKGGIKVYSALDKPEYYGSMFSAMVRAGGKIRKDKKGVVALVEAHA